MASESDERAIKLVEKYKDQLEVLDGIIQITQFSPFTVSENYNRCLELIESNLAIRYDKNTAEKVRNILGMEELLKVEYDSSSREKLMNTLVRSKIIEEHFKELFKNSLQKLSNSEKLALRLLLVLRKKNIGYSSDNNYALTEGIYYSKEGKLSEEDKIYAYLNAIGVYDSIDIKTLLIKSGIANIIDDKIIEPYYVNNIRSYLLDLLPKPKPSSIDDLLSKLVSKGAFDELSILEELIENNGSVSMSDYNSGLPSWKGIIGKFKSSYIALSPFVYDELKGKLYRVRDELINNYIAILEKILESLREKYFPTIEFTHKKDDIEYFEVELGVNRPRLVISISPWITPKIPKLIRSHNVQIVLFLTNQSLAKAEQLKYNYGYYDYYNPTMVSISNEEIEVNKSSKADPLVDEIIELFKSEYKTPQTLLEKPKVTESNNISDLSWIEKLIDKPSKAMGVYRTLLYMISKDYYGKISSRDVLNSRIIKEEFLDKYFAGKPDEAREVAIAIKDFTDTIVNTFFKDEDYSYDKIRKIYGEIEDRFYSKFLDAFKEFVTLDTLPKEYRGLLYEIYMDIKRLLDLESYVIRSVTPRGTVEIYLHDDDYDREFIENVIGDYAIEVDKLIDGLTNRGLAITYVKSTRKHYYAYLIIPAPLLEIIESLKGESPQRLMKDVRLDLIPQDIRRLIYELYMDLKSSLFTKHVRSTPRGGVVIRSLRLNDFIKDVANYHSLKEDKVNELIDSLLKSRLATHGYIDRSSLIIPAPSLQIIESFKDESTQPSIKEKVTESKDISDLSWIEKLIDKPSKAMGVYAALLYIRLYGAPQDVNTYDVLIKPEIKEAFIDKHFAGMPSEARDVMNSINEFCNKMITATKTHNESIVDDIENKFYEKFLNAFKYYLKFDIIPQDVRNVIHQFILDCDSRLYGSGLYGPSISKLTQKGTLQVEIGIDYKSYFGEHLAKSYRIREESKIKEILSYLINSGLVITWSDLSKSGKTRYDYLIIPAPSLQIIESFKAESVQQSIQEKDKPKEDKLKEEVKVIDKPKEQELKGEIIIGSDKETKQWGILGKTDDNKIVKFDLNAPHIIFICGKMGSGKGYAIGVLSEMLCSNSINGICKIEKPSTIIVFYAPKEDKRSEFWSIRYKNDVKEEVDKLRREYSTEPLKVIDDDKFRVFIDPFVYENALDKFKKDYETDNIFPIHVNPSTLTGEEWAIVLSAGNKSDQLYIKRLFEIIEKRQFKQFSIDDIKSDILKDEELYNTQKKLAKMRIEVLENYLKHAGKDFIDDLAIGGVNIFDFRKIIKTPDDLFSIMTLILSRLQTKEGLEEEPFVFVINEAHDYFKGNISEDFVNSLKFLIRRKRHGKNWLILDTHFPDDVDDKIIKLADIKMVNFLDIAVKSEILNALFKGKTDQFSKLEVGQTLIQADNSSLGKSKHVLVNVRPRLTKHGAPTKKAVE